MKKFLSFILCASLLLVSVIMSACNDDKTYWETSYKNISQTLAEEKYTFVFDQSKMQRKDNIKTACETNENFKMLVEVYDFCFYQSIGFVKTYYQGLQIKPINLDDKNSKNIKREFENFDNQFESFKKSCNAFLDANATFNNALDEPSEQLGDGFSVQKLKEFEREYSNFINQTLALCDSFESLYKVCYLDINNAESTSLGDKIIFVNNALKIKMLKLFVKIELEAVDGVCTGLHTNLKDQITKIDQNTSKQISTTAKYGDWLGKNVLFENEYNNAFASTNNFEFKSYVCDSNCNAQNYLNKHNQTSNAYMQTFDDFTKQVLPYFVDLTSNLFV